MDKGKKAGRQEERNERTKRRNKEKRMKAEKI